MARFERSSERKSDSRGQSRDSSPRRDSSRRSNRSSFNDNSRGSDRGNDRKSFGRDSGRDRDSGRSRDFGRGSRGDRSDRGDSTKTKVTCSSCGNQCEVPFKPTGNKPVYCSDCFVKQDKVSHSTSSTHSNRDLDAIHEKLNKIMKALKIDY